MDQWSMKVFLSLAGALHFGRAARDCNLSPSAVSRTVQRLEEEVGQRLFIRDNRSVSLTEAGLRFQAYAREALGRWQEFQGSLAADPGALRGELSLYCSVAAAYTVLDGLIPRFRERHPGVHIRLETGDPAGAIARLQEGRADITVAARPETLPATLEFKTIAVTPLRFIAPAIACEAARLVAKAPIPWARVPLILSEWGLSRRRTEAWMRARRARLNVYASVSGHEAIISMVRLGCGVGVVPEIVLQRFAGRGEVRVLDVEPPLEPYVIGVCAHRRRLAAPIVKAFWETVEE
jgi:LysR family positive regulator for ilvC